MACASSSMSDIIEQEDQQESTTKPLIRQYCANEVVPGKMRPLQNLLHKQPAAMGVVQMVSGITSFGLGVVLAATSDPLSLTILFRVPIFTGLLFFISGVLSAQLHKFSRLLPICFVVNIGCLCVAGVGIVLLIIDLSQWNNSRGHESKVKAFILSMTALEVCIAAVLLFWFHAELRNKNKSP